MDIAQNNSHVTLLLDHCRLYADACAAPDGLASTPVPGLAVVRALYQGELQVAVQKPVIAMLLQGRKRVTTHSISFEYAAGDAMVISADIPTVSQVTRASIAVPYYALVLELDPAILSDLSTLVPAGSNEPRAVRVEPIEMDVVGAALRLVRLLDQPGTLTALAGGLVRELHYWLLMGVHGPAIRALGKMDSHSARIGRAVHILRREFRRTIRVNELADAASMSEPAFHRHFRNITTLSPVQFQKQLRLIEARRLMLAESTKITHAAYIVGYASVSQFTREYGRLFDVTPAKDMRLARDVARINSERLSSFQGCCSHSLGRGQHLWKDARSQKLASGSPLLPTSLEVEQEAVLGRVPRLP